MQAVAKKGPGREPYQPPAVEVLGTLQDLTLVGDLVGADGEFSRGSV